MKALAILGLAASVPLTLAVLVSGVLAWREAGGDLLFLVGCGSVVVSCLSVAHLFDRRQNQPPRW